MPKKTYAYRVTYKFDAEDDPAARQYLQEGGRKTLLLSRGLGGVFQIEGTFHEIRTTEVPRPVKEHAKELMQSEGYMDAQGFSTLSPTP